MDTIQVKLVLNRKMGIEEFKCIERYINNIRSPHGHTFCDVLDLRDEYSIGVKISYPRYFYGNNVYLITTSMECFQVQNTFCEEIKTWGFKEIFLERVDIPFTYIIDDPYMDFNSYNRIYCLMAIVHEEKKKRGTRKMYSDILSQNSETLIYADSKTISAYNEKVTIYNQFLNMQGKLDEDTLNVSIKEYPDLKQRIRIEASKRIRRNPFTIDNFKMFNIIIHYLPQLKKTILDNLLDFEIIDNIYDIEAINLGQLLYKAKELSKINYEVFILQNISRIYDYEILRRALGMTIENIKTRESAVTVVRRILNNYSLENHIIIMDVYSKLKEIENYIKNFQII